MRTVENLASLRPTGGPLQALAVNDVPVKFQSFDADCTNVFVTVGEEGVRVRFSPAPAVPAEWEGHCLERGYADVWTKTLATCAEFKRYGPDECKVFGTPLRQ